MTRKEIILAAVTTGDSPSYLGHTLHRLKVRNVKMNEASRRLMCEDTDQFDIEPLREFPLIGLTAGHNTVLGRPATLTTLRLTAQTVYRAEVVPQPMPFIFADKALRDVEIFLRIERETNQNALLFVIPSAIDDTLSTVLVKWRKQWPWYEVEINAEQNVGAQMLHDRPFNGAVFVFTTNPSRFSFPQLVEEARED